MVNLPTVDWAIGDHVEVQLEDRDEHCDCCYQLIRKAHPVWAPGTVTALNWAQGAKWHLTSIKVEFDGGERGFAHKGGNHWTQSATMPVHADRVRHA